MKSLIYIWSLCFSLSVFAQENESLAKSYYDRGEFEKALVMYQNLFQEKKNNSNYLLRLVDIHQQLEQYNEAETLLRNFIKTHRNPQFLVELGYTFQLKGDAQKAEEYYQQAIDKISEEPPYAYYVAIRFEAHALIDKAAIVYEKAMELRPDYNYHVQLARIYGEQGELEKMFTSYINFLQRNPKNIHQVKRTLSQYISENSDDENNILLRKVLLRKIQTEPSTLWNSLLSWLFIQQKDYSKAFAQEKAIYKRAPESLRGIINLAKITTEQDEVEVATKVLNFVIENVMDPQLILNAYIDLLEMNTKHAEKKDLGSIHAKYQELLEQYGRTPQTIDFQLSYAKFLAFNYDKPNEAISFLKQSLETKLQIIPQARAKLLLGDILVLQEKFNEALIYYSQIQTRLKNSSIAQQARFKVAKASFYKGDFKWAESQLKVLKSSVSQLIANDALDLKLLISDNKYDDSTQTALKLYAKADLLDFQNKTDEAISKLAIIVENHKTESIMDQALYKQAQLFEKKKEFEKAESNYLAILKDYREDILADDAYYRLAELYSKQLAQPEKAKEFYEKIIFDHADSIYFVESRKKYRALRGDAIN